MTATVSNFHRRFALNQVHETSNFSISSLIGFVYLVLV